MAGGAFVLEIHRANQIDVAKPNLKVIEALDIGKNAQVMASCTQHTKHLPDKNNDMKSKVKRNRCNQYRDTIVDMVLERITIGQQE